VERKGNKSKQEHSDITTVQHYWLWLPCF